MKTYVLLLSLLFISGCVGLPFFGSDVLNVQQSVLQTGTKDVMIIRDAFTIPAPGQSGIPPDTQTILSFTIENQDDIKEARSVGIELFDAAFFRSYSNGARGPLCNDRSAGTGGACQPSVCPLSSRCTILPGEQKQVDFNMITLTQEEIAGVKQDSRLETRLFYDFDGALNYLVPVVDLQEVIKRQRTNEKTTITVSKSHGSGPIQIDVELQGAPYMLAGQDAVLLFKLQNKGSGSVKDSKIETAGTPVYSITGPPQIVKGMIINFPAGFDLPDYQAGQPSSSLFACSGSVITGWTCTNTKPIEIFKDESRVSMRFKVRVDTQQLAGAPFRSYDLNSRVYYTYELRNTVAVTINPFQNA